MCACTLLPEYCTCLPIHAREGSFPCVETLFDSLSAADARIALNHDSNMAL